MSFSVEAMAGGSARVVVPVNRFEKVLRLKFDSFAGNGSLKTRISALFEAGRMPHALILEGPKGSGKGTLARILAQAVVCRGEGEKPCGDCLPCRKVAGGYHPDVTVRTGGSAARSFHIDEVRTLRSDAYLRPNEAEKKVYILENVQNMSDGAQNAILKILEEPPSELFFILTCESATALLPTILSRAPSFSMGAVGEEEALPLLWERFPDRTDEALRQAAALSDGNVGRMLDGLEGGVFAEAAALAREIAIAAAAKTELELLALTAPLMGDKERMRAVLGMLILLFRDGCMCRDGHEDTLSGENPALDILRSRLTQVQLLAMIEVVESAQTALDRGANQTLLSVWFPARLKTAG